MARALTDEMILDRFEQFLPPVPGAVPVPPERHEQLGFLPPLFATVWRRWGFGGMGRGLFWLLDPVEWVDVVDAWVSGLALPMGEDRWWAVSRNAFGDVELWGERCGPSLTINPHEGWVTAFDRSSEITDDGGQTIAAAMFMTRPKNMDVSGPDGRGMFDAVEARLGPVAADEMYSFVPHPRLGGPERSVDTAVIEKAIPQLLLLADVGPIGVLTFDGVAY